MKDHGRAGRTALPQHLQDTFSLRTQVSFFNRGNLEEESQGATQLKDVYLASIPNT